MSIIKKVVKNYREKGFFGLCCHVVMKVLRHFLLFRTMEHRLIIRYLKRHYDYVIDNYKHYAPPPVSRITYTA